MIGELFYLLNELPGKKNTLKGFGSSASGSVKRVCSLLESGKLLLGIFFLSVNCIK